MAEELPGIPHSAEQFWDQGSLAERANEFGRLLDSAQSNQEAERAAADEVLDAWVGLQIEIRRLKRPYSTWRTDPGSNQEYELISAEFVLSSALPLSAAEQELLVSVGEAEGLDGLRAWTPKYSSRLRSWLVEDSDDSARSPQL